MKFKMWSRVAQAEPQVDQNLEEGMEMNQTDDGIIGHGNQDQDDDEILADDISSAPSERRNRRRRRLIAVTAALILVMCLVIAVAVASSKKAKADSYGNQTKGGSENAEQASPETGSNAESKPMHSNEGSIPFAPKDLQEKCALASIHSERVRLEECEMECKVATCCSPEVQESCLDEANLEACMSYQPCVSLKIVAEEGTVPVASPDLGNTCSAERISTREGRQACEKECDAGACCYALSKEENCLEIPANEDACASYNACTILTAFEQLSVGGILPLAPEDIINICSLEQITASDEGREKCAAECEIASCCSIHVEDSCLNANNMVACSSYHPCALLAEEGIIPVAPPELEQYCSVESISSEEGREACELGCQVAACCDADAEKSCFDLSTMKACASYKACTNLHVLNQFSNGSLELAPENLEEICSPNLIISKEGREECEKECEVAACCSVHANESCFGPNNAFACASYLPCASLTVVDIAEATVEVPMAPADIALTCSAKNISMEYGLQACKNACLVSACCDMTTEESCLDAKNIKACMSYLPCLELRAMETFSSGSLPVAPQELPALCSTSSVTTEEGRVACEEACEVSLCCSPHAENTCLHVNNMVACATYSPCAVLSAIDAVIQEEEPGSGLIDFFIEGVPEAPDDLCWLCSNNGNPSECERACDAAECCFASNVRDDCFFENTLACLSYMPWCAQLIDFDFFPSGYFDSSSADAQGTDDDPWKLQDDYVWDTYGSTASKNPNDCHIPEPSGIDFRAVCPTMNMFFGVSADCRKACSPASPCFRDGGHSCQHENCRLYTPWCAFLPEEDVVSIGADFLPNVFSGFHFGFP